MRNDVKCVFKYDRKRGLCMKEVAPGREKLARFYAIGAYSDSIGLNIAEFLNHGFTEWYNRKFEEIANCMRRYCEERDARRE